MATTNLVKAIHKSNQSNQHPCQVALISFQYTIPKNPSYYGNFHENMDESMINQRLYGAFSIQISRSRISRFMSKLQRHFGLGKQSDSSRFEVVMVFFSGNLLRVFSVMNKETSGGHMKKKLHWYPLVIGDEALFLWWYWSDRSNWRGVLWIFDDYTESFIFFEYCKRCFLVKHACIWVWKIRYLIPSTVN